MHRTSRSCPWLRKAATVLLCAACASAAAARADDDPPRLLPAKPLAWTAPVFTEAARRARVAGEVLVEMRVGTDGGVEATALVGPTLPLGLATSALVALRGWRFAADLPARCVRYTVAFAPEAGPDVAGGATLDPDRQIVRVWAADPTRRIAEGFERGTPLELGSGEALDVAAAVFRHEMARYPSWGYRLSLHGHSPPRAFLRRFADVPASVRGWRALQPAGAILLDVQEVRRSPYGGWVARNHFGSLYEVRFPAGSPPRVETLRREGVA